MFWLFRRGGKEEFYEKIKSLDNNVRDSFDNIKNDMKKVSEWISTFSTKDETHEKKISILEERIEYLNMMVEHLNSNDTVVEQSNRPINAIDEAIRPNYDKENRVFTRVQSFNRSVQSFMNVHEHHDLGILTPAQKQVIALLTYAGGPLSYEDISRGLGIDEVTARRHMNDIRRAGFGIKRKVSVKNRRNMFYLDEEVRENIAKSAEPVKVSKNRPK